MYEYWFATINPIPDRLKFAIRNYYGSAKEIYDHFDEAFLEEEKRKDAYSQVIKKARGISEDEIRRRFEELKQIEIRFIPWFHSEYPEKLKMLADPPYALYVKGQLPDPKKLAAAIVGARTCSVYGEEMSLFYGEALAKAGFQIISGMARGIDGASQRGAINGNGSTYAILGSGPDICYPREHMGLYMDIQKKGGVLSEYPPGTRALARHFPARNRIISGLADVLLVIEAKEKSGSLITADCALDQGKEVFALPGPVTSALSQGCHQLIRQGAGILISPETLLFDLGVETEISVKMQKMLETEEDLLYSFLDFVPKSLDQLIEESKLPPSEVAQQLISLELDGKIREVSKNHYTRCRLTPA